MRMLNEIDKTFSNVMFHTRIKMLISAFHYRQMVAFITCDTYL